MKVLESFKSNQGVNNDNEYAEYKIYIDENEIFSVHHNSKTPTENTLFNNFKDCYNIMCLLKDFYELGRSGVELEFGIK